MFTSGQGHPVVMENNPHQMRYNRRHAPQPGYWGPRQHLGGYGRVGRYGDIGGKAAKAFFRADNPWLYLSGTGLIIAGVLVMYMMKDR